jgi:hypothetical protein
LKAASRRINRGAFKWVIVACVAFALARAEESPNYRASKTGPAISVRPVKRLVFDNHLVSTPGGGFIPSAIFAFIRSGDTSGALHVSFILTGTAELEADYTRVILSEFENPAVTNGEVQSVTFAPGQRIQFAYFKVTVDGLRERAEYIRVKIPEPIQNGIVPPEYHLGSRSCATIWISGQKQCDRVVPTPGGGAACIGRRSVLPAAYYTAPRCVEKPLHLPGVQ